MHTGRLYFFTNSKDFLSSKEFMSLIRLTPFFIASNITSPLEESIEMVFWAIDNAIGGEIFIPKIPSFRITDLADAIGPNCKKEVSGIREGEKLHEEMITSADSFNTFDIGNYYTILPSNYDVEKHFNKMGQSYKAVKEGFSYVSNKNIEFLSKENLRELIKLHVDPTFTPR